MQKLSSLKAAGAIVVMSCAMQAQAELSANIGFASEYYYRGIFQTDSSASAGIDYEKGGIYVGAWTADVDDGLEYDIYGGYGFEVGEVSLSAGYTGYFYTGDFDDTYQEFNFSAGWKFISIGYTVGEYDNFEGDIDPDSGLANEELDYDFLEVTLSHGEFSLTYGDFGDDLDGDYLEAGWGRTISDIDVGVSIIVSSDELAGTTEDDEAIVFTLGKSFDL